MAEHDAVNHPSHYTSGSIECIEAIKASMTPEEFRGYLKGNVLKYLWRYELKRNPLEDLQKAQWLLNRLIAEIDEKRCDKNHDNAFDNGVFIGISDWFPLGTIISGPSFKE